MYICVILLFTTIIIEQWWWHFQHFLFQFGRNVFVFRWIIFVLINSTAATRRRLIDGGRAAAVVDGSIDWVNVSVLRAKLCSSCDCSRRSTVVDTKIWPNDKRRWHSRCGQCRCNSRCRLKMSFCSRSYSFGIYPNIIRRWTHPFYRIVRRAARIFRLCCAAFAFTGVACGLFLVKDKYFLNVLNRKYSLSFCLN